MLAMLLSVLVNVVGYGQNFEQVDYRFNKKVGKHDFDNVLNPDRYDGHVISLAANGYGQWAADDAGHWYLLADSLSYPSTESIENTVPDGIIAKGDFQGEYDPKEVKVVCNLKGDVRFVWPSEDRKRFHVQGFGAVPDRMPDGVNPQIDISFSDFPNGLPHGKSVIKSDIHTYTPQSIVAPANTQRTFKLCPLEFEDWRDIFDVTIDEKYLYIVYRTYEVQEDPLLFDVFENVYLMVLDLKTGDQIHVNKILNDVKPIRPTVAVDVRQNTPDPVCFIGYISHQGNGIVRYGVYSNGNILVNAVSNTFLPPFSSCENPPLPLEYTNPKHVRMLVGSTKQPNQTNEDICALYVIANGQNDINSVEGDDLLVHFFRGSLPEANAHYVDGVQMNTHQDPVGNGSFPIANTPMVAFANPYDGQNTIDYNEFHCVYQLSRPTSSDFSKYPLLTARGADNGMAHLKRFTNLCDYSEDTRTVLTREYNDNTNSWDEIGNPSRALQRVTYHIGAVNQKGIHVRWIGRQSNVNTDDNLSDYYSRDVRRLDEPIEENTLLTYTQIVSDGESHDGTVGARVLEGNRITFWTDPSFNNSALYMSHPNNLRYNNCCLYFEGQNAKLEIGRQYYLDDQQLPHVEPAFATFLPNFEVWFGTLLPNTLNQRLIIHAGSTVDYFGVPTNSANSNFNNFGKLMLSGYGSIVPSNNGGNPSSGTNHMATFNIRGGATLQIPDAVTLEGTHSMIDCKHNIADVLLGTNLPNFGKTIVNGTAALTDCKYTSRIPTGQAANTLLIGKGITPGSVIQNNVQFSSTSCRYENIPNDGKMRVVCQTGNTSTNHYREVTIDDGQMRACSFEANDPILQVILDGVYFSKTTDTAIRIIRSGSNNYSTINVLNNSLTFDAIDVNGINIEGFDTRRTSTDDLVLVDNNTIASTASSSTTEPFGIQIKNSDAKVTNNEISGAGFWNGIVINGLNIGSGSTAFMCTNTITGVSDAGIYTNWWRGYSILSTVSFCGKGFKVSGTIGNPHIHFSTMSENDGPGLLLTSDIDLRLDRLFDGNYSIAGHNTISHNNQLGNSGQMEIQSAFGKIFIGSYENPTVGGQNNIIANDEDDYFGFKESTPIPTIVFPYLPNYWAIGEGDGTPYTTITDPFYDMFYRITPVVPQVPQNQSNLLGAKVDHPEQSCGNGYLPQSFPSSAPLISECGRLFQQGEYYSGSLMYKTAYDTLRFFIEQCPIYPTAPGVFSMISGNAYELVAFKQETSVNYREWLKSVLYLNPDSLYYCKDAIEIAITYIYKDDSSVVYGDEAATVFRFLADSAQCSFMRNDILEMEINLARYHQYRLWKDTVSDSLKTPYNPGYTSLEALDLTILRGFKNAVNADITKPLQRNPIAEAIVIPNPIKDEMELRYKLTEGALVKIEVYDALGKQMYSLAQGYKPEGENRLHLDTRSWSSGSYYARFTTLGGEVKTIKLLKE